jgi:hypothetical protein
MAISCAQQKAVYIKRLSSTMAVVRAEDPTTQRTEKKLFVFWMERLFVRAT